MPKPAAQSHFIAKIREITGLNQKSFAGLVGVSQSTIQSVEICRIKLSYSLAEKIALATGCGWWLYHKKLNTPEKSRILEFEGVDVSKANNGLTRRLSLTKREEFAPFTREYFENYTLYSNELRLQTSEIARLEARVSRMLRESSNFQILSKVQGELNAALNLIAEKYELERNPATDFQLRLESLEESDKSQVSMFLKHGRYDGI